MQPPAIAMLTQLAELAEDGDLDSVLEVAQQMQEGETAAFAQEIIRLADACEIKQLRTFIQQYM